MMKGLEGLTILFIVAHAIGSNEIEELQSKRELSEDDRRIDDIMHTLQGACVHEKSYQTVKQLKKDTQAILNNIDAYKEVVKLNKQLRKEIEWIVKDSNGPKEISRIILLLKRDIRGICLPLAKGCEELKDRNAKSGVYKIHPIKSKSMNVYCDMETDGGGWTVFQRRMDGTTDFQRSWDSYKNGFGNLEKEFWLGNENIYQLLSQSRYVLRIELESFNGVEVYAEYSTFHLGSAATNYRLRVDGYSGTAGDSLKFHNGMAFTTKDRDNDLYSKNCASSHSRGGWWYRDCIDSSLNGIHGNNRKDYHGIYWGGFKNNQRSIRKVSLKIRKLDWKQ